MRQYIALLLIAGVLLLPLLAACDPSTISGTATPVQQAGTTTTPRTGQNTSEAASYCKSQGGEAVTRYPAYDASSDNPLRLSGSLDFCQFTAQDKSMIAISVDTLYTDQPTLATLAYLQKPPLAQTSSPSANPASAYCSKLGGSDLFGGVNASSGGWLSSDKSDPFYVLEACIFPDLSTIDSWGLTYHTNGTIRGTDLSKVIRYQMPGTPTPGLFGK